MDELREAFNEAFDKDEANQAEEATVETVVDVTGETENTGEVEETAETETTVTEPVTTEKTEITETTGKTGKTEKTAKTDKAPGGWSPAAREHWAGLPDQVKQQVAKREKEAQQAMDNSASARRMATQLNQTLSPFTDGLQASGFKDPFQAIETVLQTEASLRIGSAQQKAETVAYLIQNYGIDIATLDGLLSGQPVQTTEQTQLETMFEQRMGPVNQLLEQMQQNQTQNANAQQQHAHDSVNQFSENAEFMSDVRMDMADLLDMSAKRGQDMTLEQAYHKACAIHPEISQVIAQRNAQKNAMGNNQSMESKRAASNTSLTGGQGGAGGTAGNLSMRQQIEEAWNSQTG